jgi:hypothetical protein
MKAVVLGEFPAMDALRATKEPSTYMRCLVSSWERPRVSIKTRSWAFPSASRQGNTLKSSQGGEDAGEISSRIAILKKPERRSYGDTSFYKGGYYELEVEEHEVRG